MSASQGTQGPWQRASDVAKLAMSKLLASRRASSKEEEERLQATLMENSEEDLLDYVDGLKEVRPSSCPQARNSTRYGRTTVGLQKLMATEFGLSLPPQNKVFVDAGSGIGELDIRIGVATGVETHGIEVIEGRHQTALQLVENAKAEHPGLAVSLHYGSLQSEKVVNEVVRLIGTRQAMIFFNNFGETSDRMNDKGDRPSVDDSAAAFLGKCQNGSRLLSLSPILALDKIEKKRAFATRRDIPAGGPTMTFQGSDAVSAEVYLYTKNRDPGWKVSCETKNSDCRDYDLVRTVQVKKQGKQGKQEDLLTLLTVEDACPKCKSRGGKRFSARIKKRAHPGSTEEGNSEIP